MGWRFSNFSPAALSTPTPDTMPKDQEPSHLQRDFTLAAIKQGIRTDGRRLDEARPWELEWVGGEDGGVECRLGKTRYAPSSLATDQGPVLAGSSSH